MGKCGNHLRIETEHTFNLTKNCSYTKLFVSQQIYVIGILSLQNFYALCLHPLRFIRPPFIIFTRLTLNLKEKK